MFSTNLLFYDKKMPKKMSALWHIRVFILKIFCAALRPFRAAQHLKEVHFYFYALHGKKDMPDHKSGISFLLHLHYII